MVLEFIKNFKYLKVLSANAMELKQLKRIVSGSRYNHKLKRDETVCYMSSNSIIPSGFYGALLGLKSKGYDVNIKNFDQFKVRITKSELGEWINKQDLELEPYEYQFKSTFIGLNFRQCRVLLDTSAGKSFIIYLYSLYLLKERLDKDLKVLVLVPRTMLVKQLPQDFLGYSKSNEIICDEIMAKGVLREGSNVVVGNINSVVKKPLEWFKQFGAIIVDEGHKSNNESTQKVLNIMFQMKRCDYIFGMSGTFEMVDGGGTNYDEYSAVTETAYLGAVLLKIYQEELLEQYGSVTPTKINIVNFNADYKLCEQYYNHPDNETEDLRFLFESNYIQGIPMFRRTINKIICANEYNQVALFNTTKILNQMADECRKYCEENNIDRDIFIITGKTPEKKRDIIIKRMNASNKAILFSMYSILSTGISIKLLTSIHLVDSTKAVDRLRQSIGRVLRLHPSKKTAIVFDYTVTFKKHNHNWGGGYTNSYAKHSEERIHVYNTRKFPNKVIDTNLSGVSEFMKEIPRVHRIKEKK